MVKEKTEVDSNAIIKRRLVQESHVEQWDRMWDDVLL